MSFVVLDLTLLVLFSLFVFIFIHQRRSKLHKEGWMYLYKTSFGLQFIDKFAKKYSSLLHPTQYLIIFSGLALMFSMIALLVKTLFIYLAQTDSSPLAKVPAIFPLIPYFPELFNLDSVFPPFYFTYFIIAIAIVAISHEAAHGIIARLNKIRIKSTGFAFLGPFLGAFVEQDDKQMNKAPVKAQLAILAAGTFANVVMAVLFGIVLIIVFLLTFHPLGYQFDAYAYTALNTSDITTIANSSIPGYLALATTAGTFYAQPVIYDSLAHNASLVLVYEDTPAFQAQLGTIITNVNGQPITSRATLVSVLEQTQPNQTITITTRTNTTEQTTSLVLAERAGKSYLGIASLPYQAKGIIGSFYKLLSSFKEDHVVYQESFTGAQFIYDLLWWIVIINILVALFNMFPAGMLDGGRFLYLIVFSLSGSKKVGKFAFTIGTYFLLAVLAVMMVKWLFVIF